MGDRDRHSPPGALTPGAEPDIVMMICTAGHVDHGKTRLVKLLTGCNTDRLKIEQERGLTIELGFAPCVLEGNVGVGIVDVPGHEKFVRTMVAGVSGIELTILVVAADDGVKPQTVEHLRIMEFMGVSRGIVAVTKIDLVTPERLREAILEIGEFLKGTFLECAPVCPVSSETFEGYAEFYTILAGEVGKRVEKERHGVFRMPVEKVFGRRGFGAVVMGIPTDGSVGIGDRVELVPGGKTGKVRGIQQFLRDTDRGGRGQCLALNIPDFNKTPPERGQVLGVPGYCAPSRTFHVRLHAVPGLDRPLKNADEIKFHTGTAEDNGKLYLLEEKTLSGGSALAAIVLNSPVVASAHDRFIVRRSSPAATVAGGEILDTVESADKPRKRLALDRLQAYERFMAGRDPASREGMEKRIEYFLLSNGRKEASIEEISKGVLLTEACIAEVLTGLVERGTVFPLDQDAYIHADSYRNLAAEAKAKLEDASIHQGVLTLSTGDLQKGFDCSLRVWKAVEEALLREGIVARSGNTFVLAGALESMSENDRNIIDRVLSLYEETGFGSPRPDELPDLVGAPEKTVTGLMEYLYSRGLLIRLSETVTLSRAAFIDAQHIVVDLIRERGELDSADFKYHIASSRKYALAILDRLDSMHVTIRSGNIRKLSPDYERRTKG
jgi:selenocysteine-specific elongation factor